MLLTAGNSEKKNGARIIGMKQMTKERFEFKGAGNECLYRVADKHLVVAISLVA